MSIYDSKCQLRLCNRRWRSSPFRGTIGSSTLVVFTLLPEMHDQPVRSGRTRHSSPSRHGRILHHHFCRTIEAEDIQEEEEDLFFLQWRNGRRFFNRQPLTLHTFGGGKNRLSWLFDKVNIKIGTWSGGGGGALRWQATFDTRRQSSRRSSHLSRETGALDRLRALFNLVLVAAPMGGNNFTRPRPLLLWP